ncbi:MAG TPA: KH domain-containing protein, partial [Terriglobales bacterium]|nr:KH domain-containing protein [Terriglobales bacterium]
TDQPERFLAAEIVREKAILATEQELPYAVTVMLDKYEELPKLTRIYATLYCERDGQKKILIGKGGAMLKKIGTNARYELERILGTKVYLELFVKVQPGWRESKRFLEEQDWRLG